MENTKFLYSLTRNVASERCREASFRLNMTWILALRDCIRSYGTQSPLDALWAVVPNAVGGSSKKVGRSMEVESSTATSCPAL